MVEKNVKKISLFNMPKLSMYKIHKNKFSYLVQDFITTAYIE